LSRQFERHYFTQPRMNPPPLSSPQASTARFPAVKTGWICFVLGVLGLWIYPLGVIFLVATFVFAILALRRNWVVNGVFLLVFSVAALALCTLDFMTGPPNETHLLQTFHAHQAAFEQLRDMLQADGEQTYVMADGEHSANVTGERLEKYRAVMKEIPAGTAQRWDDLGRPRLVIVLWAVGFAGEGARNGVCWTASRPSRLVSSLDAFERNPRSCIGVGWVFMPIG
jgi:hypothetical protein